MSRRTTGPEIERLIQLLAKLPGLGPRSARRAALFLIKNRERLLKGEDAHALRRQIVANELARELTVAEDERGREGGVVGERCQFGRPRRHRAVQRSN